MPLHAQRLRTVALQPEHVIGSTTGMANRRTSTGLRDEVQIHFGLQGVLSKVYSRFLHSCKLNQFETMVRLRIGGVFVKASQSPSGSP